MVAKTPSDVLGPAPVLQAALVARTQPDPAPAALAELRDLAGQEAALALRLGMVLACIKQFDVAELGYSGFLSFCRDRVDWGSSWMRAIVRLVESPLEQVKAAAAAGLVPLRVAVQAPGRITADQQAAWLCGAVFEQPRPSRPRTTYHHDEAEIIAKARELASACIGRPARVREVDDYIMQHWREQTPGKALEEGRTPRPAPEPRELDFRWAGAAPAQALLGPWRAPADLAEAIAQLDAVRAARRTRLSSLARGFARVHHDADWLRAGYDSPWAYAREELGWSRRTAQRYHKLGWALTWFPQLDDAVREGFSPEMARDVGWFAERDAECDRLLDLARHLGPQELKRALANGGERLPDYQRALAIARRHAAALLGPDGPTTRPSGVTDVVRLGEGADEGATPAGTAEPGPGGAATPAGTGVLEDTAEPPNAPGMPATPAGTLTRGDTAAPPNAPGAPATPAGTPGQVAFRIALPPPAPRPPDSLRAHPDLLEAARWFLAHNQPRPLTGFAACKELAFFRCQNPDCGRITLLLAAHHIHWRCHGGSDDPRNAVGLCSACHTRGVHTGDERIRVTRAVLDRLETLLWEYVQRVPVIHFREVPPRPAPPSRDRGAP